MSKKVYVVNSVGIDGSSLEGVFCDEAQAKKRAIASAKEFIDAYNSDEASLDGKAPTDPTLVLADDFVDSPMDSDAVDLNMFYEYPDHTRKEADDYYTVTGANLIE